MYNARSYARYSSLHQREESIEGQLRACKEYAVRNEYTITGEYSDRAISGKSAEKRTQFQRMIRDAERGLFDVLLVYKLDRFARNRYDAAMYKAKLKKSGVKVISIMEAIPEGAEGIILESVLDGFAEYYSENLAENVRRGLKENALSVRFNGGQTPYGYRIVDSMFLVDDARAIVVREIFERVASGESYRTIFESLNARGFRTLKGKDFSRSSINSIVDNEKYIGRFVYNVSKTDSVKVENGFPSIVSEELWNAVQSRRAASSGAPRRGKGTVQYVLSGKLICCHCGAPFHGHTNTYKGTLHSYYRHCHREEDKPSCMKFPLIRRNEFDTKVFNAIRDNILNPETIHEIAVHAASLQKECEIDIASASKAELSEVQAAIQNIYKAIEAGVFSNGLNARLASLESRAVALAADIAVAAPPDDFLSMAEIESYLSQFMHGDINDTSFRNSILSTFVKRVEIKVDGTARIILHYAPFEDVETISFVFGTHGLAQVLKPINPQDAGIVLFT